MNRPQHEKRHSGSHAGRPAIGASPVVTGKFLRCDLQRERVLTKWPNDVTRGRFTRAKAGPRSSREIRAPSTISPTLNTSARSPPRPTIGRGIGSGRGGQGTHAPRGRKACPGCEPASNHAQHCVSRLQLFLRICRRQHSRRHDAEDAARHTRESNVTAARRD